MSTDNINKPGDPGSSRTIIKKINDNVYYSLLSIPDFISSEMNEYIPAEYQTAHAIDLSACATVPGICTDQELERVSGARSMKRQVEWLCGRIVLKDLLRTVLFPECDYCDIIITYGSSGRPLIEGNENIGISVTHSGDVAMAALHTVPGKRIGIDAEKNNPTDAEAILAVAFSKEDRELYNNRPVDEIISAFTMKEAYLKITGLGFRETITRVSVRNGIISHEGHEVPPLGTCTISHKNEYIITILYEL